MYLQNLESSQKNSLEEPGIKLLQGEAIVAKAQNVLMFEAVSESKQGISGVLCVTNFKLTFVTADGCEDVSTVLKYALMRCIILNKIFNQIILQLISSI